MRSSAHNNSATLLTSRQRLARGLSHTATGPVDVGRGLIGLGASSALSGAAHLRRHYRQSRLAREVADLPDLIADEFAAAQDVVAGLPQALQEARRSQHRRWRPVAVTGVAVALLAGGTAALVFARRSGQAKETSPRPPSVDVQPKP